MSFTIRVPEPIKAVLDALHASGFEAFAVGGCVRDALLGRVPNDWDVCTSALPEETKSVFADRKVIETGIQHGTVTVLAAGSPVEITTYRVDGTYSDGRRPDSVTFTPSLREDLARRDFTVNAMAYDPQSGLIDHFGGQQDLQNGIIRCVGEPSARFSEDALRILRAVRFASVLGFSVEETTAQAVHRLKHTLSRVSAERIAVEINKLLTGKAVGSVLSAYPDLMQQVFPGLSPDGWTETVNAIDRAKPVLPVRMALLLRGLSVRSILRSLKYDTKTIRETEVLAERIDSPRPSSPADIRQLLHIHGEDGTRRLLEVWEAAYPADGQHTLRRALLEEVLASGECWQLKQLAVSGKDMTEAGLHGAAVGEMLNTLLRLVMEGVLSNDRASLMQYVDQNRRNAE